MSLVDRKFNYLLDFMSSVPLGSVEQDARDESALHEVEIYEDDLFF
jgi:hypothetical protein